MKNITDHNINVKSLIENFILIVIGLWTFTNVMLFSIFLGTQGIYHWEELTPPVLGILFFIIIMLPYWKFLRLIHNVIHPIEEIDKQNIGDVQDEKDNHE